MRRLIIDVDDDAYCELRQLARMRNLDVVEYIRQAVGLDKLILERRPRRVLLDYGGDRYERIVFNYPRQEYR